MVSKEGHLELATRFDEFIDQVGEHETHLPVFQIDNLSPLIENFESVYVPELVIN